MTGNPKKILRHRNIRIGNIKPLPIYPKTWTLSEGIAVVAKKLGMTYLCKNFPPQFIMSVSHFRSYE